MPTKKQHFVPRVYLKAWETQVETLKEPDKKFKGIYVIKDGKKGEGANRNSVLWMPHLYTINFKYLFICNSCSKVKSQFVDMIFDLLRKSYKQPVYGKIGYSTIKTKKSIQKHLYEIDDWEFYYEDGNIAKKAAILSQIDALNSYVLEDAFDDYLEKNWENILNSFSGLAITIKCQRERLYCCMSISTPGHSWQFSETASLKSQNCSLSNELWFVMATIFTSASNIFWQNISLETFLPGPSPLLICFV